MAVTIKCQCGKRYVLPDSWAGSIISCRFCGAENEFGEPDPAVPVPGLPVPPGRRAAAQAAGASAANGANDANAVDDVDAAAIDDALDLAPPPPADADAPLPLDLDSAPAAASAGTGAAKNPARAPLDLVKKAAAPAPQNAPAAAPDDTDALPIDGLDLEPLDEDEDPTRPGPAERQGAGGDYAFDDSLDLAPEEEDGK